MFVSEPASKLDIPIFVIAIAPGEVKAWRSETWNHEEVGRNLAGAHCLAERREINLAIRRRLEGMNQHDRRGCMKIDRRQQCRCGSMQQLVADGIVKMFNLQQSMQEIEAYLLVFRMRRCAFHRPVARNPREPLPRPQARQAPVHSGKAPKYPYWRWSHHPAI